MKPYPKYKKTNIDWIGEIPEHWELRKIKWNFNFRRGKNPKSLSLEEIGKPYLSMSYLRNISSPEYVENPSDYIEVNKSQTLLLWDGSNAGEFIRSKDGVLSSTMAVIDGSEKSNFNWFYFKHIEKLLKENTVGMGIPHVDGEFLRNLDFIYPESKEQAQIATYLDHKTTLIDKLIASNEKQIKLLEEKRKATINQAVTKGLDPDVKFKKTGIEWIDGDGSSGSPQGIPEHWEVKKLKYSVQLLSEKGNEFKKIALENIQSKTGKYIETETIFQGDGVEFNKGDILFGKLRPYLAKVWEAEFQGSAVGDFFVMRPNKSNNPTYRKYQILSDLIIDVLNGSTYGAKMPRVSWDFMGELLLPEPPIDQQEEIANYLDGINQETQDLIIKVRKQNKLLKEYRQSLISHVVTGKVDVRGEVKMLNEIHV